MVHTPFRGVLPWIAVVSVVYLLWGVTAARADYNGEPYFGCSCNLILYDSTWNATHDADQLTLTVRCGIHPRTSSSQRCHCAPKRLTGVFESSGEADPLPNRDLVFACPVVNETVFTDTSKQFPVVFHASREGHYVYRPAVHGGKSPNLALVDQYGGDAFDLYAGTASPSYTRTDVPCGGPGGVGLGSTEMVETRVWSSTHEETGSGDTRVAATIETHRRRSNCTNQDAPVDCLVSDWGNWTACSGSCGPDAVRTRTRTILAENTEGGTACPNLTETERCHEFPCPIDCTYSAWSNWSVCSSTCGSFGLRQRTRTILKYPTTVKQDEYGAALDEPVTGKLCGDEPIVQYEACFPNVTCPEEPETDTVNNVISSPLARSDLDLLASDFAVEISTPYEWNNWTELADPRASDACLRSPACSKRLCADFPELCTAVCPVEVTLSTETSVCDPNVTSDCVAPGLSSNDHGVGLWLDGFGYVRGTFGLLQVNSTSSVGDVVATLGDAAWAPRETVELYCLLEGDDPNNTEGQATLMAFQAHPNATLTLAEDSMGSAAASPDPSTYSSLKWGEGDYNNRVWCIDVFWPTDAASSEEARGAEAFEPEPRHADAGVAVNDATRFYRSGDMVYGSIRFSIDAGFGSRLAENPSMFRLEDPALYPGETTELYCVKASASYLNVRAVRMTVDRRGRVFRLWSIDPQFDVHDAADDASLEVRCPHVAWPVRSSGEAGSPLTPWIEKRYTRADGAWVSGFDTHSRVPGHFRVSRISVDKGPDNDSTPLIDVPQTDFETPTSGDQTLFCLSSHYGPVDAFGVAKWEAGTTDRVTTIRAAYPKGPVPGTPDEAWGLDVVCFPLYQPVYCKDPRRVTHDEVLGAIRSRFDHGLGRVGGVRERVALHVDHDDNVTTLADALENEIQCHELDNERCASYFPRFIANRYPLCTNASEPQRLVETPNEIRFNETARGHSGGPRPLYSCYLDCTAYNESDPAPGPCLREYNASSDPANWTTLHCADSTLAYVVYDEADPETGLFDRPRFACAEDRSAACSLDELALLCGQDTVSDCATAIDGLGGGGDPESACSIGKSACWKNTDADLSGNLTALEAAVVQLRCFNDSDAERNVDLLRLDQPSLLDAHNYTRLCTPYELRTHACLAEDTSCVAQFASFLDWFDEQDPNATSEPLPVRFIVRGGEDGTTELVVEADGSNGSRSDYCALSSPTAVECTASEAEKRCPVRSQSYLANRRCTKTQTTREEYGGSAFAFDLGPCSYEACNVTAARDACPGLDEGLYVWDCDADPETKEAVRVDCNHTTGVPSRRCSGDEARDTCVLPGRENEDCRVVCEDDLLSANCRVETRCENKDGVRAPRWNRMSLVVKGNKDGDLLGKIPKVCGHSLHATSLWIDYGFKPESSDPYRSDLSNIYFLCTYLADEDAYTDYCEPLASECFYPCDVNSTQCSSNTLTLDPVHTTRCMKQCDDLADAEDPDGCAMSLSVVKPLCGHEYLYNDAFDHDDPYDTSKAMEDVAARRCTTEEWLTLTNSLTLADCRAVYDIWGDYNTGVTCLDDPLCGFYHGNASDEFEHPPELFRVFFTGPDTCTLDDTDSCNVEHPEYCSGDTSYCPWSPYRRVKSNVDPRFFRCNLTESVEHCSVGINVTEPTEGCIKYNCKYNDRDGHHGCNITSGEQCKSKECTEEQQLHLCGHRTHQCRSLCSDHSDPTTCVNTGSCHDPIVNRPVRRCSDLEFKHTCASSYDDCRVVCDPADATKGCEIQNRCPAHGRSGWTTARRVVARHQLTAEETVLRCGALWEDDPGRVPCTAVFCDYTNQRGYVNCECNTETCGCPNAYPGFDEDDKAFPCLRAFREVDCLIGAEETPEEELEFLNLEGELYCGEGVTACRLNCSANRVNPVCELLYGNSSTCECQEDARPWPGKDAKSACGGVAHPCEASDQNRTFFEDNPLEVSLVEVCDTCERVVRWGRTEASFIVNGDYVRREGCANHTLSSHRRLLSRLNISSVRPSEYLAKPKQESRFVRAMDTDVDVDKIVQCGPVGYATEARFTNETLSNGTVVYTLVEGSCICTRNELGYFKYYPGPNYECELTYYRNYPDNLDYTRVRDGLQAPDGTLSLYTLIADTHPDNPNAVEGANSVLCYPPGTFVQYGGDTKYMEVEFCFSFFAELNTVHALANDGTEKSKCTLKNARKLCGAEAGGCYGVFQYTEIVRPVCSPDITETDCTGSNVLFYEPRIKQTLHPNYTSEVNCWCQYAFPYYAPDELGRPCGAGYSVEPCTGQEEAVRFCGSGAIDCTKRCRNPTQYELVNDHEQTIFSDDGFTVENQDTCFEKESCTCDTGTTTDNGRCFDSTILHSCASDNGIESFLNPSTLDPDTRCSPLSLGVEMVGSVPVCVCPDGVSNYPGVSSRCSGWLRECTNVEVQRWCSEPGASSCQAICDTQLAPQCQLYPSSCEVQQASSEVNILTLIENYVGCDIISSSTVDNNCREYKRLGDSRFERCYEVPRFKTQEEFSAYTRQYNSYAGSGGGFFRLHEFIWIQSDDPACLGLPDLDLDFQVTRLTEGVTTGVDSCTPDEVLQYCSQDAALATSCQMQRTGLFRLFVTGSCVCTQEAFRRSLIHPDHAYRFPGTDECLPWSGYVTSCSRDPHFVPEEEDPSVNPEYFCGRGSLGCKRRFVPVWYEGINTEISLTKRSSVSDSIESIYPNQQHWDRTEFMYDLQKVAGKEWEFSRTFIRNPPLHTEHPNVQNRFMMAVSIECFCDDSLFDGNLILEKNMGSYDTNWIYFSGLANFYGLTQYRTPGGPWRMVAGLVSSWVTPYYMVHPFARRLMEQDWLGGWCPSRKVWTASDHEAFIGSYYTSGRLNLPWGPNGLRCGGFGISGLKVSVNAGCTSGRYEPYYSPMVQGYTRYDMTASKVYPTSLYEEEALKTDIENGIPVMYGNSNFAGPQPRLGIGLAKLKWDPHSFGHFDGYTDVYSHYSCVLNHFADPDFTWEDTSVTIDTITQENNAFENYVKLGQCSYHVHRVLVSESFAASRDPLAPAPGKPIGTPLSQDDIAKFEEYAYSWNRVANFDHGKGGEDQSKWWLLSGQIICPFTAAYHQNLFNWIPPSDIGNPTYISCAINTYRNNSNTGDSLWQPGQNTHVRCVPVTRKSVHPDPNDPAASTARYKLASTASFLATTGYCAKDGYTTPDPDINSIYEQVENDVIWNDFRMVCQTKDVCVRDDLYGDTGGCLPMLASHPGYPYKNCYARRLSPESSVLDLYFEGLCTEKDGLSIRGEENNDCCPYKPGVHHTAEYTCKIPPKWTARYGCVNGEYDIEYIDPNFNGRVGTCRCDEGWSKPTGVPGLRAIDLRRCILSECTSTEQLQSSMDLRLLTEKGAATCSGRGVCTAGRCTCEEGYAGAACEIPEQWTAPPVRSATLLEATSNRERMDSAFSLYKLNATGRSEDLEITIPCRGHGVPYWDSQLKTGKCACYSDDFVTWKGEDCSIIDFTQEADRTDCQANGGAMHVAIQEVSGVFQPFLEEPGGWYVLPVRGYCKCESTASTNHAHALETGKVCEYTLCPQSSVDHTFGTVCTNGRGVCDYDAGDENKMYPRPTCIHPASDGFLCAAYTVGTQDYADCITDAKNSGRPLLCNDNPRWAGCACEYDREEYCASPAERVRDEPKYCSRGDGLIFKRAQIEAQIGACKPVVFPNGTFGGLQCQCDVTTGEYCENSLLMQEQIDAGYREEPYESLIFGTEDECNGEPLDSAKENCRCREEVTSAGDLRSGEYCQYNISACAVEVNPGRFRECNGVGTCTCADGGLNVYTCTTDWKCVCTEGVVGDLCDQGDCSTDCVHGTCIPGSSLDTFGTCDCRWPEVWSNEGGNLQSPCTLDVCDNTYIGGAHPVYDNTTEEWSCGCDNPDYSKDRLCNPPCPRTEDGWRCGQSYGVEAIDPQSAECVLEAQSCDTINKQCLIDGSCRCGSSVYSKNPTSGLCEPLCHPYHTKSVGSDQFDNAVCDCYLPYTSASKCYDRACPVNVTVENVTITLDAPTLNATGAINCNCPHPFFGDCKEDACVNGYVTVLNGTNTTSGLPEFICVCDENYTGDLCGTFVPPPTEGGEGGGGGGGGGDNTTSNSTDIDPRCVNGEWIEATVLEPAYCECDNGFYGRQCQYSRCGYGKALYKCETNTFGDEVCTCTCEPGSGWILNPSTNLCTTPECGPGGTVDGETCNCQGEYVLSEEGNQCIHECSGQGRYEIHDDNCICSGNFTGLRCSERLEDLIKVSVQTPISFEGDDPIDPAPPSDDDDDDDGPPDDYDPNPNPIPTPGDDDDNDNNDDDNDDVPTDPPPGTGGNSGDGEDEESGYAAFSNSIGIGETGLTSVLVLATGAAAYFLYKRFYNSEKKGAKKEVESSSGGFRTSAW